MTNWQIEIARMTTYILFPIGIYYWFNHVDSSQEWIKAEKKKFYQITEAEHKEFMQLVEKFSNKYQINQLAEMEAKYYEIKTK